MINGKLFITLLIASLATLAVCNTDFTKPTVEGWWTNVSMTPYAQTEVTSKGNTVSMPTNYIPVNNVAKGEFIQTPQFQSMLAPRFQNFNQGAFIKYNPPSLKNMAADPNDVMATGNCTPMTFGNMVSGNNEGYMPKPNKPPGSVENYCGSGCGGQQRCGAGGFGLGHSPSLDYSLPVGYVNGNKNELVQQIPGADAIGNLPMGTMDVQSANGSMDQVVFSNRLMTTFTKDRLRRGSDYIRGDLAIKPCTGGWFSVYPVVATALNPGYSMVANGAENETNRATLNLIQESNAGAQKTYGGVNLGEPQFATSLARAANAPSWTASAALGSASTDISYTAFP
jgi:hypothetical protein